MYLTAFYQNLKFMTNNLKIGIAAAANNIDSSTISRFLEFAGNAIAPGDLIEISTGPTFGPYNKSRHLNDCLRKLIDKECEIIVQTDIDVEFARQLVEETRRRTEKGSYLWSPSIKDDEVRWSASGAWNSLRKDDWIRIGGFDERFFEWGAEDEDLHHRCSEAGFRRLLARPFPYHHPHELRSNWSRTSTTQKATRDRNAILTADKNYVNYLTDGLSSSRGVTLHLTSRCVRKCRECCLQDLLNDDPDYYMSENEIDDFVRALERSPVPADRVILCGGEPLLCPTLPYAIEKLNLCDNAGHLTVYTGLLEGFDLSRLPKMEKGSIRVSRYGDNDSLIAEAIVINRDINVVDKGYHTRMADKLYPEAIPGTCYNPEVFIFKGRAYTCPMVAQNLIRYGIAPIDSPLYSEPLTNRFFDRTRGWNTGAMNTCSGCAGNINLKNFTGSHKN